MTRKDYVKFAEAMAYSKPKGERTCQCGGSLDTWRLLRLQMANIFSDDNDRFDRERFFQACEE